MDTGQFVRDVAIGMIEYNTKSKKVLSMINGTYESCKICPTKPRRKIIMEVLVISVAFLPIVIALFNLAFAAVGLSPGSIGIGQLEDLIGSVIWACGCMAAWVFHWFITEKLPFMEK